MTRGCRATLSKLICRFWQGRPSRPSLLCLVFTHLLNVLVHPASTCSEDVSGLYPGTPGSMETVVIVAIGVLATIFLASFAALVVVCRQRYCRPRDLLQRYDSK